MLSMNKYDREYVDDCRAKIEAQVAAYREMAAAGANIGGEGKARYDAAAEAFEPVFFNNMVHVLDNYFVHRSRTLEKKDGNALNEVRMLCTSMVSNDGRLAADKQIKLNPEKSVLGYKVGDVIALRENDFQLLAKAFFAEIEAKFL